MNIAKIFMNGRSQAVRLPKEFRLQGTKASVTRLGNAIVLQPLKQSWQEVFEEITPTNDFFVKGREDTAPQEREGFK